MFFPDDYYRFKFCADIAAGPDRTFDCASYGFFIRDLDEINDPDHVFPITSEEIGRINPNSGTAPIFRSRRDKDITSGIYARLPVLVDRASSDVVWSMRYVRMLDLANDSGRFRTRSELEGDENAWPIGANRFQSKAGEWVPLYEGKMVQAFNHRASDIVLAKANVFRSGQGADLTNDDHRNPARQPIPRYWIQSAESGWDAPTDWCLSLEKATSVTNARTTITAIIPRFGAGHILPVLFPAKGESAPGYVDSGGDALPPFIWGDERRLKLRAKLDALYFILYGVFDPADPARSRDDIRYIYSPFPIVEREKTARWRRYRSRDLALAWINALIAEQPDADMEG